VGYRAQRLFWDVSAPGTRTLYDITVSVHVHMYCITWPQIDESEGNPKFVISNAHGVQLAAGSPNGSPRGLHGASISPA
jgi:hypothetical protein